MRLDGLVSDCKQYFGNSPDQPNMRSMIPLFTPAFMTRLLTTLLLLCASPGLHAQEGTPAPSRVPVTIVLMADVGYGGAPTVLLRREGPEHQDVLLVSPRTTAEELTEAVQGLLAIRKVHGDLPSGRAEALRVTGKTPSSDVIPWVSSVLRQLPSAKLREIHGVGAHPAIRVWLPSQQQI